MCLLLLSLSVLGSCSESERETGTPQSEIIASQAETDAVEREIAVPDLESLVPGTYVALSESEWSQELQLNADGTAELRNSNWLAGDWANADTCIYSGRWSLEGEKITLHLLESKTNPERVPFAGQLKYVAQLSLADAGWAESAPGVVNLGPTPDDSPLWRANMWRDDAIEKLPRP